MSNDGSGFEQHAGVDMVPIGESFEWDAGQDEDAPIFHPDSNLKVSNPAAAPSGAD
jgi:hypothetical protein